MKEDKSTFELLNDINVEEHTEDKNGLKYLSWAWAWAEFKKKYPDATYEIWRDESGKPYTFDPDLGYMVYTSVTVNGLTHSMWLPVMDNKNNAMKNVKYKVSKGRYTADVEPATMFDVNKAIMRCLVKNLAMFGLGLYIYAGEDLPEVESEEKKETPKKEEKKETPKKSVSTSNSNASTEKEPTERDKLVSEITEHARRYGIDPQTVASTYKINKSTPIERLKEVLADISKKGEPSDFEAIDETVPWK